MFLKGSTAVASVMSQSNEIHCARVSFVTLSSTAAAVAVSVTGSQTPNLTGEVTVQCEISAGPAEEK